MKRLLVTGSRAWRDKAIIGDAMETLRDFFGVEDSDMCLVHGGADGADKIAAQWAKMLGWKEEPHILMAGDWRKFGKYAGPRRNQQMVDTYPDICLAFILHRSRGATHCLGLARANGIPWIAYTSDGNSVVVQTSGTFR